jgi:hypothetical protein
VNVSHAEAAAEIRLEINSSSATEAESIRECCIASDDVIGSAAGAVKSERDHT